MDLPLRRERPGAPERAVHARGARGTAALALLSATSALAQEDFLRVYQWETPQQGWVELNLWTTWVVSSSVPYQRYGLQGDRTGAIAHSFEVEYGVTDRLAIGAYTDFDQPPGGGFEFRRARLVARYRLFNRYDYFFDPALYAERGHPLRSGLDLAPGRRRRADRGERPLPGPEHPHLRVPDGPARGPGGPVIRAPEFPS